MKRQVGVSAAAEPVTVEAEAETEAEAAVEVVEDFPRDTPVAQMTVEQQLAYWKDKARKHERNRRPKNWEDIVAKAEQFDKAQQDAAAVAEAAAQEVAERAAVEARDAVAEAGKVRDAILTDAIRVVFEARSGLTGDDLDAVVEGLDLAKFVTEDGSGIDRERLDAFAAKFGGGRSSGNALFGAISHGTPDSGGAVSVADIAAKERERYLAK